MNMNIITSSFASAAFAFCLMIANPVMAEEEPTPTYLLANLSVTDFDAYSRDYANLLGPLLTKAGAEILVVSPNVKTLEGDYAPNLTIVVKFPSASAADAYFGSSEYGALRPARQANTVGAASTLVLAPQFVYPAE
ncbi:DUF1330 domain-containing protein [Ahrensia sp. R2A130]|uniref:DUF1330 domain-containing protein n=1 Tax=Ahrensia sp. R2A130 TaxID=744979 RepID=UPI0001E0E83B|nr:DUF1330 domain-containing protein [Ahrensia sp. R2A130]EFL90919.1 conserved hypothetical protein [Ahrensia sp. R2A130]